MHVLYIIIAISKFKDIYSYNKFENIYSCNKYIFITHVCEISYCKYFIARSPYETILSQKAHLKQMFRKDTCKSWKKYI